MTVYPLVGHEAQRILVERAFRSQRLPQVLLLTGPAGVGKQRFGLWIGQLLLCERPSPEGPCETCQACRQVAGLAHPDLHWLMPVARPKAGEADKQVDELAQAVEETVAARRAEPLYGPPGGMTGHFVATARALQRRAALTPAQGKRKVFLLAEADRLVPQEASQEAANALLKLLEEPPADTQFLLTVTDPNLLLPTIRSRTVSLRLGRLPDRLVEQFLSERLEPRPAPEQLRALVGRAEGSIGRAIAEGDEAAKARQAAREVIEATRKGEAARMERSLKQGAWSARGDFSAMLEALADLLGEEARSQGVAGAGGAQKKWSGLPQLVRARERVLEARDMAQGNVNPQLLLAALQADLAEAL